jgi:hypothetical protein
MTTLSLKISPTLMQAIVQTMFVGTPIHLGVITTGNNIADNLVETTPEAFRAIEYNSGSWVRPTLTLGAVGSFNPGLDKWEFPTTSTWSLTGPPGGISIKQVVVILGGTTTPRDNTGVIVGVGTYTVPLDIAASAVQTIEVPWSIS